MRGTVIGIPIEIQTLYIFHENPFLTYTGNAEIADNLFAGLIQAANVAGGKCRLLVEKSAS